MRVNDILVPSKQKGDHAMSQTLTIPDDLYVTLAERKSETSDYSPPQRRTCSAERAACLRKRSVVRSR